LSYEEKFLSCLKEKGLKLTRERRLILNEVYNTNHHFEADDLLVEFRNRGQNISRASIFRTLKLLTECGLIRKVLIGENRSSYEYIYGYQHHDHLICLGCGKIIEFSNSKIEKLQDSVCKEFGFKPTDHTLKILGYCSKCR